MNLENLGRKIKGSSEEPEKIENPIINKEPEGTKDQPVNKENKSKPKKKDFNSFKEKVNKLVIEDPVLKNMRIKALNAGTYLILYQGVRSNVLARFYPNKYSIGLDLIRRRLIEPIKSFYQ